MVKLQHYLLTAKSSKINIQILLLLMTLFLASCVPANKSAGRRLAEENGGSTVPTPADPNAPDFSGSLNFLQNGTLQSSSSLQIGINFDDGLFLRGAQVDQFIRNDQQDKVQCVVIPFPNSSQSKALILAATPRFFTNFSSNTREYYYQINPSNKSSNQSFCQKTGLISQVTVGLGLSPLAYVLDEICINCLDGVLNSSGLNLYDPSGALTSFVTLSYLSIRVSNTPQDNLPIGGSCSSSPECTSKGFDCCSLGQCVKDKQLKSGVDQSDPDFLQALIDIETNPSSITNYPQFYHLCTVAPPTVPVDPPLTNPEDEALLRFTKLQELFNCTSLIEGEMSICTLSFENASEMAGPFLTGTDDRNFLSTYRGTQTPLAHSITKIEYAGSVLFDEENNIALQGATIGVSNSQVGNDNLDDALSVGLTTPLPAGAPNDKLKIAFKIDGSCERISANLGRCVKFYVQGQNLGRVDDHFPARNQFSLPYYADINRTISVKVDGTVKTQGSQWTLIPGSPSTVNFLGTGLQVFDTQKIEITYFVNLASDFALVSKEAAIAEIQSLCQCVGPECRLEPVVDSQFNRVTDFKCVYPEPDLPPPPLQQVVLLSSKSTPHRYYDDVGLYHAAPNSQTPAQEGQVFEYINNDLLRPNNVTESRGFNEIYGSYRPRSGSARPATEVRVVRGKTYDIFTETGNFSTCLSCGNDYHSNLAKLFPESLLKPGAGYEPNLTTTNKSTVRDFRGDDLIFGRACFIPATMIPWTHAPQGDRQSQRLGRLATQHFYFANGFNRDWFGFDYGSLIGSFDGVNWFSIGNQRRIQAKTNKLFIAINAYFGDLTVESSYKIVVSDSSSIPASGSTITSDFDSAGATCQKVHQCSTDTDCATKLGWDYTCQTVSNLTTPWPEFDNNGSELPNVSRIERLQVLFNANKGGSKRCVYRGKGTPCQTNNLVGDANSTFNSSDSPGTLACSSNNYCQPFISGSEAPRFNTKIARFARSVANQNASSFVPESNLDTFGLGARLIGRPYQYNGNQVVPESVLSNISLSGIQAMCIPGRNPQALTLSDQHNAAPTAQSFGDKVNGIGVTMPGQSAINYLSACSIFDTDGNYFSFKRENLEDPTLGSPFSTKMQALSATQVIPSNALSIFEGLTNEELVKNFEVEQVTTASLEENRCLRAPGSVCHTDLDCSPSNFITNITRLIDATDENILRDNMNLYEILFFQEPLVCGQKVAKDDAAYDLTKNRCCRPSNNVIRIGTQIQDADNAADFGSVLTHFDAPRITTTLKTGVEIGLDNPERNTRIAPVHIKRFENPSEFPPLTVARSETCTTGCTARSILDKQYNSLHEIASKTCCSENWIRHWHREQNGGGHRWEPNKVQVINKRNFMCKNWLPDANNNPPFFTPFFNPNCSSSDEPDDPDCAARSVPAFEANAVFAWMNKLELLGVPQIAVESETFGDLYCSTDPLLPIPGFIEFGRPGEYSEGTNDYLSANNSANFDGTLKKIFSEDEFSCCIPAGTQVPAGTSRDACCTGFINGQTGRCALPDFTNVSMYLNRYISSEAAGLDSSVFNESGFLKSPNLVEQLACQKFICASGKLMRGVLYSPLKVRGHEDSDKNFLRFIDGNDEANNFSGLADLFDAGARWNNHVYCAPQELELEDPSIFAFQCPTVP